MSDTTFRTRVQVTVEITGSSYGADWTLRALTEQTGKECANKVVNALREADATIIGSPRVIATWHEVKS